MFASFLLFFFCYNPIVPMVLSSFSSLHVECEKNLLSSLYIVSYIDITGREQKKQTNKQTKSGWIYIVK